MGNSIPEPTTPNDITTHRAVSGGVKVRRYMYISLCTTSLLVAVAHNQSSNTKREDNDANHNSKVEKNVGSCKYTTHTLKIQEWVNQVVHILKYTIRWKIFTIY